MLQEGECGVEGGEIGPVESGGEAPDKETIGGRGPKASADLGEVNYNQYKSIDMSYYKVEAEGNTFEQRVAFPIKMGDGEEIAPRQTQADNAPGAIHGNKLTAWLHTITTE